MISQVAVIWSNLHNTVCKHGHAILHISGKWMRHNPQYCIAGEHLSDVTIRYPRYVMIYLLSFTPPWLLALYYSFYTCERIILIF
jgi:hypothetical protein